MSKDAKDEKAAEGTANKKGPLLMILVAVVALGGGAGGAWFMLKDQNQNQNDEVLDKALMPGAPTKFLDLDVFTVNLQPEDGSHYLQVGLTVKTLETKIDEEIKKQMPEIRNRILLLLSSKKPSEISTIIGKQELSADITHEIRESLDSRTSQQEVVDVLFTSFVIQ